MWGEPVVGWGEKGEVGEIGNLGGERKWLKGKREESWKRLKRGKRYTPELT